MATARNQELLKALANPLRCRICEELAGHPRELSPRELADRLHVPLSDTSYHARILAGYKMIVLTRTEPVRGSLSHFYVIEPSVLAIPWVRSVLELDKQLGHAGGG